MKQPFFKFSKRIERGYLAWMILCILIIFTPRVYILFNPPECQYGPENISEQLKSIGLKQKSFQQKEKLLNKRCNPSMLTALEWQELGLSKKQAASLLRYRDKYGFHSLAQMRQIRVLNQAILERIKDSLVFEPASGKRPSKQFISYKSNKTHSFKPYSNKSHSSPTSKVTTKTTVNTSTQPRRQLDLNTATLEELIALPGLGAYSAQKIISYRERLGGFQTIDQLNEVKGLYPDFLSKIGPFLTVQTPLTGIRLNEVTLERLKQHPYLTWNQANSIIKLRQQRGLFTSIDQIKISVLIDNQTFEKLKPYLSL
jgi:competence ComEA-like helix-hairpin-helix protein